MIRDCNARFPLSPYARVLASRVPASIPVEKFCPKRLQTATVIRETPIHTPTHAGAPNPTQDLSIKVSVDRRTPRKVLKFSKYGCVEGRFFFHHSLTGRGRCGRRHHTQIDPKCRNSTWSVAKGRCLVATKNLTPPNPN